jgi:Catalase
MAADRPSTDWSESVSEDEAARHAAFAERIVAIQTKISAKSGPGRAFHRKQIAGVRGDFTVLDPGDPVLQQGLFAQPQTLPCLIRISNGAMTSAADVIPDVRGFAISVRNVSGPGSLASTTDRQDFLLINRPVFGFRDSKGFADIVGPAARGQAELAKFLIDRDGPVGGPLELARLTRDFLRPFTGFATATFHSANPLRYGDYAVRIRLRPSGKESINPLAASGWRTDIAGRLRQRSLTWDFQVQLFVSEETTPIEDGSKNWSESVSPFHTVARVVIPQQDLNSVEATELDAEIERGRFDPWSGLAMHRPLGEIMRARKVAYYPSQQARDAE